MARELQKRLSLPGNPQEEAEKNGKEKREMPKLVRFCESAEELEVLKRYKTEKLKKQDSSFNTGDINREASQSLSQSQWLPPEQQIKNNNGEWKSKIEDMPKPKDPELARKRAAERKRRRQACGKMKAKMRFEAKMHEAEKKRLQRQIENLEEVNSAQQEMLEDALRK